MRDVELVLPHDSVLLGKALTGEVAAGLLASLTVEEIAEVVRFNFGEVALPHWNIIIRTDTCETARGKGWGLGVMRRGNLLRGYEGL